jgi:hypothetical protein
MYRLLEELLSRLAISLDCNLCLLFCLREGDTLILISIMNLIVIRAMEDSIDLARVRAVGLSIADLHFGMLLFNDMASV